MENIDSILNTDYKDSVYYLSQCRKFCQEKDWYNALKFCEDGIKNDAKVVEFYQRAIVCCIKMLDGEKAVNFLSLLKQNCNDVEMVSSFQKLISDELKDVLEGIQGNNDYKNFINLKKTILQGGGKLANMSVNLDDPNNRFIVAEEDIKTSEVIAKVPRQLTLSPSTILQTEIGKFFDNTTRNKLNSFEQDIITVFLLHEVHKGHSSEFSFLFNFFPKDYSNFPVFYQKGGVEEEILENTKFKFLIKNEKDAMEEDFKILQATIPFMKKTPLDDFLFMREVVASRVFSCEEDDNKSSCIMVPFCDLLNHKKYPNVIWSYDKNAKTFNMITTSDIKAGAEILTKYGNKGNENLLLHYGFTLEHNVDDTYIFLLKLCNGKKGPEFLSLKIKKDIDDSETKKLFAYLRYMVTDSFIEIAKTNSLPDEVISDQELKRYYVPSSGTNELKMLKFLGIVVDHYSVEYKTTYEEDLEFFEKNKATMSTNEINCWRVRIQEKEVLKFYKDFSEYCLTLFSNRNDEVLVNSMVSKECFDVYKNYINFVFNSLR